MAIQKDTNGQAGKAADGGRAAAQRATDAAERAGEATAEAGRGAAHRMADAGRRMTDEASRAARVMADEAAETGIHTADAVADIARSSTETMQQAVQSSMQMASQVTERSLNQFARVFGMPSRETEEVTQQTTRNIQAVVDCGSVLANGFQDISREWMTHARNQFQKSLDSFGALMRARSPQDAIAIQADLARDTLEDMLQGSRRMSELFVGVADQAMGRIAAQQSGNGGRPMQAEAR